MKSLLIVNIFLAFYCNYLISQVNDYWKNAPVEGSYIYSICFKDQQNGYAISSNGDIFESSDSGYTWFYKSNNSHAQKSETKNILWSAEIFCSIMQTTDGGNIWLPYSKEEQEHFCRVYLKDPNVGYRTANEFLNKVTLELTLWIKSSNIDSLILRPQQCTEYYTDENEGWALGWCVKNVINNSRSKNSVIE